MGVVAVVGLATTAAYAQPGGGNQRGRGARTSPTQMIGPMMAQLADSNRSGDVTAEEWDQFMVSLPQKEGKLDRDALKVQMVTQALDTNKDGLFDGKDVQPLFAEMDRDGDKVLTAEELRGRGQQGRRGRGAEGGRGEGGRGAGRGGSDEKPGDAKKEDGKKGDTKKKATPRKEDLFRQDAGQDPAPGQDAEPRRRGRGQDGQAGNRRRGRGNMADVIARSARGAIVRQADADSDRQITEAEWTAFVKGFDGKAQVAKLLAPVAETPPAEGEQRQRRRRSRSIGQTLDRFFGQGEGAITTPAQLEKILEGMDRDSDGAISKEEMTPRRLGRSA